MSQHRLYREGQELEDGRRDMSKGKGGGSELRSSEEDLPEQPPASLPHAMAEQTRRRRKALLTGLFVGSPA